MALFDKNLSLTLVAAVSNGIAQSQSPGGAGNLTLNGSLVSGGVATLDSGGAARRVLITSAADDSSKTFTVYGTDRYGRTQSEAVTGGNTTGVYTNRDFLTVTRIAVSAATAGAVTAGTNGVGSTAPWIVTRLSDPSKIGYGITSASSTGYNLEGCYEDFADRNWDLAANDATWFTILDGSAGTNQNGTIDQSITMIRLTVTTGTGNVKAKLVQPFGV